MEGYRSRIIDELLKDELDAMGAVLIEGSKACGKTTTAEQAALPAASEIIGEYINCNAFEKV